MYIPGFHYIHIYSYINQIYHKFGLIDLFAYTSCTYSSDTKM